MKNIGGFIFATVLSLSLLISCNNSQKKSISENKSDTVNNNLTQNQKTMNKKIELSSFKIVGISVRTINKNKKAATDMKELWEKFYSENISSKIPNITDNEIYCVYTDYKSDYTEDYTAIIGHKVSSIDNIPAGMVGQEVEGGNYFVFNAQGKRPASVISKWQEIWDKDKELNRKYTDDFEVYGERSKDPDNSEVEIYVATK